jgi:hypothetical protein
MRNSQNLNGMQEVTIEYHWPREDIQAKTTAPRPYINWWLKRAKERYEVSLQPNDLEMLQTVLESIWGCRNFRSETTDSQRELGRQCHRHVERRRTGTD